jgi:hexosaminidase
MKSITYLFPLLFLIACQSQPPRNIIEKELPIIPAPMHTVVYDQSWGPKEGLSILTASEEEKKVAEYIQQYLKEFGLGVKLASGGQESNRILLESGAGVDSLGEEGYLLDIDHKGVSIRANTAAGLFYGFQSFAQLLPLESSRTIEVPQLSIVDKPRLQWRGLHLDVCRHFFPVEFVKKYIDQMARYKLNTFHWHLTEDQGWRIEIKKYPKLTEVGSMRKETILEKNFKPYIGDGTPHGGYYSQDEIREVVAYAAERHVAVVPEIEMPGHSLAALSAYPEFSCTGGPFEVGTKWGVYKDIYCSKDATFAFLTDILDEVVELFPSEYIHIGGDEAPKDRWKECPRCQARIQEEGLEDESELQSYFIKRIEKHLATHNRKLIGWDEILEGGLSPNATVMSWRGEDGGIEAANQGHDVVMTPNFVLYFDHYQGPKETEPLAICCYSPLEKVYAYDPVTEKLPADKQRHIIGVQANMWTEYMQTTDHVEYMAYPRVLALSEIAWSQPEQKDWEGFQERLRAELPRLKARGVNYRDFFAGE